MRHSLSIGSIRPASTFIEAKGFIKEDWLVEIEADCVLEEQENFRLTHNTVN